MRKKERKKERNVGKKGKKCEERKTFLEIKKKNLIGKERKKERKKEERKGCLERKKFLERKK